MNRNTNFNFAGFLLTVLVTISDYLVTGFVMGFFASLVTIGIIAGGTWCYWTWTQKNASQRVETHQIWGSYYRMEVA